MSDELIPWVDEHYRTEPAFRTLVGHSYGGLFALYALMNRPDAFQAYLAISPSMWWNGGAIVSRAKAEFRSIRPPHFLYVSWGDDEESISNTTRELMVWLDKNPAKGIEASHHYYPGEDHGTTPHRTLYDGLQAIFQGWRMRYTIAGELRDIDIDDVEQHYKTASDVYGFAVSPSVGSMEYVGRYLLEKRRDPKSALEAFHLNSKRFPYLPSVHESLGEVLLELGREDEALSAFRTAMMLGVDEESAYTNPVESFRLREAQIERARSVSPKD